MRPLTTFWETIMSFSVEHDFATALQKIAEAKGKAELILNSGQRLSGRILAVGKRCVHMTELVGKEFFDAMVAIEEIAAIEMRVR